MNVYRIDISDGSTRIRYYQNAGSMPVAVSRALQYAKKYDKLNVYHFCNIQADCAAKGKTVKEYYAEQGWEWK